LTKNFKREFQFRWRNGGGMKSTFSFLNLNFWWNFQAFCQNGKSLSLIIHSNWVLIVQDNFNWRRNPVVRLLLFESIQKPAFIDAIDYTSSSIVKVLPAQSLNIWEWDTFQYRTNSFERIRFVTTQFYFWHFPCCLKHSYKSL